MKKVSGANKRGDRFMAAALSRVRAISAIFAVARARRLPCEQRGVVDEEGLHHAAGHTAEAVGVVVFISTLPFNASAPPTRSAQTRGANCSTRRAHGRTASTSRSSSACAEGSSARVRAAKARPTA